MRPPSPCVPASRYRQAARLRMGERMSPCRTVTIDTIRVNCTAVQRANFSPPVVGPCYGPRTGLVS